MMNRVLQIVVSRQGNDRPCGKEHNSESTERSDKNDGDNYAEIVSPSCVSRFCLMSLL
jgi:hypothetical protein